MRKRAWAGAAAVWTESDISRNRTFRSPRLPGDRRFLTRASAAVLVVATGVLVVALPAAAQAAPSDAPATATSSPTSAPATASATSTPSGTTSPSTPPSGTPVPSIAAGTPAPAKGVERHRGMMPATSPDARSHKVAAGAQTATPGAQPTTSAAGALPVGVDVASYQHPNGLASDINWGQVAGSGQSFAMVKATEGDYYTNPFFSSDINAAHAAGLVVGGYHYAIPSISATAQADMFASTIGSMPTPSLPPVLDLEENDGLDVNGLVSWTNAFLTRLQADTGIVPMIYTSPSFWGSYMGGSTAFAQYYLWEASWFISSPQAMGGWGSNWTMWQFDDCATITGISGCVDHNYFNTANGATPANMHNPVGHLDTATLNSTGMLTATGWSFDPDTPTSTSTVHVYVDSTPNGVLANLSRPDVGAAFPAAGSNHGFSYSGQLTPGGHTVCAFGIDTGGGTNSPLGCIGVTYVPNTPTGSLDTVAVAADGTLTAAGWTFDPDTPTTAVTVHLYIDGQWNQAVTANGSRPDIGAAFPAAGDYHGFTATASVAPGSHTACLYAIDTAWADQHTLLGCRTVSLVPNLPIGWVDRASAAGDGTLTVSGWAIDPDTPTTADTVQLSIDGQSPQAITANGSRPDIGAAFPAAGNYHGFTATAQLTLGSHTVCLNAVDTYFAGLRTLLGCRTVTVVPNLPIGAFDSATVASNGTLSVSGWAFDPDTATTADTVHLYIDGQWSQAITANVSRPDIGAAFPTAGANHGLTATAQVTPGSHTACLYAIDTSFADQHTLLGCRTVTLVPNLPIGVFDTATVGTDGTLTASGWAFDPDTPTVSSNVDIYVDGVGQRVVANGSRPDVGAAFPTAGSNHGFSYSVPVSVGGHTVCAYAIDTTFSGSNSPLGCRSVTR